jgi:hypothetical protein
MGHRSGGHGGYPHPPRHYHNPRHGHGHDHGMSAGGEGEGGVVALPARSDTDITARLRQLELGSRGKKEEFEELLPEYEPLYPPLGSVEPLRELTVGEIEAALKNFLGPAKYAEVVGFSEQDVTGTFEQHYAALTEIVSADKISIQNILEMAEAIVRKFGKEDNIILKVNENTNVVVLAIAALLAAILHSGPILLVINDGQGAPHIRDFFAPSGNVQLLAESNKPNKDDFARSNFFARLAFLVYSAWYEIKKIDLERQQRVLPSSNLRDAANPPGEPLAFRGLAFPRE